MLKTKSSIKQIADEVAKYLSFYITIDKIILFGSYRYGKPKIESDFDLAVISEDFEKMSILEKIELFAKAALEVDSRVELKGFSRKSYLKSERGSFIEMIKKKGKVVFSS